VWLAKVAPDRPLEPSAWSGWVRRVFKRHSGVEVAPKTLRSVFITWLRDSTDAPEILKSAAHAQKHSVQRQASADYDQEADDRLVKASYDFNLSFANQYPATLANNGAGSSSAHAAVAPRESLARPGKERTRAAFFAFCSESAFASAALRALLSAAIVMRAAPAASSEMSTSVFALMFFRRSFSSMFRRRSSRASFCRRCFHSRALTARNAPALCGPSSQILLSTTGFALRTTAKKVALSRRTDASTSTRRAAASFLSR
jgi:hypothetical protein